MQRSRHEDITRGRQCEYFDIEKPSPFKQHPTSKRSRTPSRRAESGAFTQHNHGKQPYNEGRVSSAT